jgi:hypothetical protein
MSLAFHFKFVHKISINSKKYVIAINLDPVFTLTFLMCWKALLIWHKFGVVSGNIILFYKLLMESIFEFVASHFDP